MINIRKKLVSLVGALDIKVSKTQAQATVAIKDAEAVAVKAEKAAAKARTKAKKYRNKADVLRKEAHADQKLKLKLEALLD